MAEMSTTLRRELARSIESKLRRELSVGESIAGFGSATVNFIANWIYRQRTPESPFSFIQYYNLTRSVVRNARDAATMQANPNMTILDLQRSPGVPENFPRYEYRAVVAGYNQSGEEVYSTLVYVYSDTPLTGDQVTQDALHEHASSTQPPGFLQSGPPTATNVYSYRVFIVSAGRK